MEHRAGGMESTARLVGDEQGRYGWLLRSRSSIGKGDQQNSSEKQQCSGPGGHVVDTAVPLDGANCYPSAETDSQLATLIAGWTKLPEPIRLGIIAMVKAVT